MIWEEIHFGKTHHFVGKYVEFREGCNQPTRCSGTNSFPLGWGCKNKKKNRTTTFSPPKKQQQGLASNSIPPIQTLNSKPTILCNLNQLQLYPLQTFKKGPSHFRVMEPEIENLPFNIGSRIHPGAALTGKVMKQKKTWTKSRLFVNPKSWR